MRGLLRHHPVTLRRMRNIPDCRFVFVLHEDPEREAVRYQEQRHNKRWKEKGRSQLSRHETRMVGLIERVQQIGRAPEIEDPRNADTGAM